MEKREPRKPGLMPPARFHMVGTDKTEKGGRVMEDLGPARFIGIIIAAAIGFFVGKDAESLGLLWKRPRIATRRGELAILALALADTVLNNLAPLYVGAG
jgi:hypothetical protein